LYDIFRSGTFVRACVNNDIRTVEKILQTTHGKEHLNDVNEDGDSVLALACSWLYRSCTIIINNCPSD
jgi:hypothetical protein